jgi:hypothetical protein
MSVLRNAAVTDARIGDVDMISSFSSVAAFGSLQRLFIQGLFPQNRFDRADIPEKGVAGPNVVQ